jgi:hypothetical protein
MRNGADDAMMAAAGVAVTSASCANAAFDSAVDGMASLMDEPISGFAKFMIFLSIPVGIGLAVAAAKIGLGYGWIIGAFYGGWIGWWLVVNLFIKRNA